MKMTMFRLFAGLFVLGLSGPALAGDNLLTDPGFEQGTDINTFDAAWSKSGNVYHELVTPRAGFWTAKLFGNFTGETSATSLTQEFPAAAGAWYTASVFMRHNSDDRLQGANEAWVELEFLGEDGATLARHKSPTITAKTDPDEFRPYSTGKSRAPAGTVKGRFRIVFTQQADQSPGAVFCDDAAVITTP